MNDDLVNDLFHIFHKYRHLNHKIKSCQAIPHSEFLTLAIIEAELKDYKENNVDVPGVKVSYIAKRLKATKPAISKLLNSLEEKEYIIRISDKVDRRAVYIRLTENGTNVLEKVKKVMDGKMLTIVNRLGEKNTKELIRLLDMTYNIMEDEFQKG